MTISCSDPKSAIKPGYTQTRNHVLDHLIPQITTVNSAAGLVLIKIEREAVGWHNETAEISMPDFESFVGRGKDTIRPILRGLHRAGIITILKQGGGLQTGVYRLNLIALTTQKDDFSDCNIIIFSTPEPYSSSIKPKAPSIPPTPPADQEAAELTSAGTSHLTPLTHSSEVSEDICKPEPLGSDSEALVSIPEGTRENGAPTRSENDQKPNEIKGTKNSPPLKEGQEAKKINRFDSKFSVVTSEGQYNVGAILLSTGTEHRKLNAPGEKDLQ